MLLEKKGSIAHVIFHNNENGYTVAVFETEEEQFTIVGNLIQPREGATYILHGDFTVHPKFGEQFKVSDSEELMPEGEAGMIAFLASGIIKGIGPKAAAKIVDKFGEDTFRIIEEEPERLTQISGIGEKKAASICEAFSAHKELAEISVFLQKYDINAGQAAKLYAVYGSGTIEKLQEDPYAMIDDIFGIGFVKADAMAAKLGFDKEHEHRIRSGIMYRLTEYVMSGNVFVPRNELAESAAQMLDVSIGLVDESLVDLVFRGQIKIEMLEGREVVYQYHYLKAEQNVAYTLAVLQQAEPKMIESDIDALIEFNVGRVGVPYSEEQRKAIRMSLESSVSVITGGPGTGKTTIIKGILDILSQNGMDIAIAAPTGRAAKRITETTGYPASTIHRLLEYSYGEDEFSMKFAKNEENPLKVQAVVIDEASMVDLMLMDGLVRAIKPGTRLILVGDADQLPSVGAGNVLGDILESDVINSIKLTEIFRQAEESMIVVNAHRINNGERPSINDRDTDFFFIRTEGEAEMAGTIKDLCATRLPGHYTELDPMKDIQVLTPVRKGNVGVMSLNKELQQTLNPPAAGKNEKSFGGRVFREGDKVMQIKNNYEKRWKDSEEFTDGEGVFNGDLGVIDKINNEYGYMTVVFDDSRYVNYEFGELEQLEMAYAITVHKSQGSEFPIVVMPMSWFPPMLATRNLLYTAVTRGKQAVVMVGSESKMLAMIENDRINKRYSGLAVRLKGYVR